jgi:hypothetical protein
LAVLLPDGEGPESEVRIEFPESVLAQTGEDTPEIELYGNHHETNEEPSWRIEDGTIEYSLELRDQCSMTARATADPDGLLMTYVLTNHSDEDYSWILPATCIRQEARFEDHSLERTYVHVPRGFELLASETPERLDLALKVVLLPGGLNELLEHIRTLAEH